MSRMFSFITERRDTYHKLPDVETLARLYFDEKLSTAQIARMYGSSKVAVRLKLKRNGYLLRSCSEGQDLVANHISLSSEAIEYLDGLLLGDGTITISSLGKSAAYRHTDKHKEYVRWLMKRLQRYGLEASTPICQRGETFFFCTKWYRELVNIRYRWYPNGKKRVPKDLELTPIVLKNWYIGDGSYRPGKKGTLKGERVLIACIKLDKNVLNKKLQEIGVKTSVYPYGFYIKSESRPRFFQYMLSDDPEIPPGYQYKFPIHYIRR